MKLGKFQEAADDFAAAIRLDPQRTNRVLDSFSSFNTNEITELASMGSQQLISGALSKRESFDAGEKNRGLTCISNLIFQIEIFNQTIEMIRIEPETRCRLVVVSFRSFKSFLPGWIHETFSDLRGFSWQEGHGAFSVSKSGVERTFAYIGGNASITRNIPLKRNSVDFLNVHKISFDPKYLLG